jgi:ABC-type uncharacterized transport system permease subunit
MINELFDASVLIGIASSGIRLATPYLYAAIGETFGQRSGVLNLGVEGIMLMGAFSGFWAVYTTDSLLIGVLVALLVDGVHQRHSESGTGDQRHRHLPLRPGPERAALSPEL